MNKERYAVEQTIRHVTSKSERYYFVRLYEYSSKDDTIEPSENLPKDFADAYCRRKKDSPSPLSGGGMTVRPV